MGIVTDLLKKKNELEAENEKYKKELAELKAMQRRPFGKAKKEDKK